jgi:hypothetical protein
MSTIRTELIFHDRADAQPAALQFIGKNAGQPGGGTRQVTSEFWF